jgi:hypothetical protein
MFAPPRARSSVALREARGNFCRRLKFEQRR